VAIVGLLSHVVNARVMQNVIDPNTPVSAAGELALIDALAAALPPGVRHAPNVILPIGDDAALVDMPPGQALTVTSDTMVEWDHFRLDWTDWRSLGHKLLAVNLSDLAAMGARPLAVTVTLGLTGNESLGDLASLYEGLGALAEAFGVGVIGGDIVRSRRDLFLECTAMGCVAPDRAVRRTGAHPGDVVVVSGTLGASAAGWRLLERRETTAATADLLIGAHLRPLPRVALGALMAEAGVTAAMDLSDGLSMDLPRIARASGVGFDIVSDAVPVAAAVRALFPDDWRALAWSGGEDYELVMTIAGQDLDRFIAAADTVGSTITCIGVVTDRPGEVLLDGRAVDSQGWDHFG
jgi:thiamine-monophosphate kinase